MPVSLSDAEDRLLPAFTCWLGAMEREWIPADNGPRKKRMRVHLKVETVDADYDSSNEEINFEEALPRSDPAVDAIPRLMQKIRALQGTRVLSNNSDEQ